MYILAAYGGCQSESGKTLQAVHVFSQQAVKMAFESQFVRLTGQMRTDSSARTRVLFKDPRSCLGPCHACNRLHPHIPHRSCVHTPDKTAEYVWLVRVQLPIQSITHPLLLPQACSILSHYGRPLSMHLMAVHLQAEARGAN